MRKVVAQNVDETLSVLKDLLREGYDTVTFLANPRACNICRRLDGESRSLRRHLAGLRYDAPLFEWSHVNCSCSLLVTGEGLEDVEIIYDGTIV
jgi:DNA-binding transcriptional ArsR family regulator